MLLWAKRLPPCATWTSSSACSPSNRLCTLQPSTESCNSILRSLRHVSFRWSPFLLWWYLSCPCGARSRHWLRFRERGRLSSLHRFLFVFHKYLPRECAWIIRLQSGNWEYVENARVYQCGEDLGRVGSQHQWDHLWQFQE